MSIRRRLFLLFALLMALSLLSVGLVLKEELRDNYAYITEEGLAETSFILSSLIKVDENDIINTNSIKLAFSKMSLKKFKIKIQDYEKSKFNIDAYVTDKKGIVLYSSRDNDIGKNYSKWNDVFLTLQGKYGTRATREKKDDPHSSIYYIASPVLNSKNQIVGVVSVIKSRPSIYSILQKMVGKIIVVSLLVLGFYLIVGLLLTHWITNPIKKLKHYIEDMIQGKRVVQPDIFINEFSQLSSEITNLRDSLEGKKNIEKYTQNLTHELKSPLTAIIGSAELMLEDMPLNKREIFLSNILKEGNKGKTILDRMLDISKLERKMQLDEKVEVNLQDLFIKIKDSLSSLLNKDNINLKINIQKSDFILGDTFLLEQAMRNLIQNSIDFSFEGSVIEIDYTSHCLTIEDFGQGIPDFAKDRIFEKFYSLPRPNYKKDTSKGTGLGLSFVKEVLDLHHADINFDLKEQGVKVTMNFNT